MTGVPETPPSPEAIRLLRREYALADLVETEVTADPFGQFGRWFAEALNADLREPNAMTVATAAADGTPAARIVLLKAWDERGFTFYTNYEGQKGRELAENPRAALLFFWAELERQVRVGGDVIRLTAAESDRYFASRPFGSRLGAIVSPQSRVIPDRETLPARLHDLEAEYMGGDPPRPAGWGGYRVVPTSFEFWQGRPNRLHDRLRYRRDSKGGWTIERLAP